MDNSSSNRFKIPWQHWSSSFSLDDDDDYILRIHSFIHCWRSVLYSIVASILASIRNACAFHFIVQPFFYFNCFLFPDCCCCCCCITVEMESRLHSTAAMPMIDSTRQQHGLQDRAEKKGIKAGTKILFGSLSFSYICSCLLPLSLSLSACVLNRWIQWPPFFYKKKVNVEAVQL